MAIINLTYDNVDGIIGEVHNIFNQERTALMEQVIDVPEGVGDDIYSWLLPREDNKKILDAMPKWYTPRRNQLYLKVNTINQDCPYSPTICLPLKEEWYALSSSWLSANITGAEAVNWNGNVLYLFLEDTESGLPQGQATDFVKKLYAIAEQHRKITEKTEVATSTMREFLGQHRTLQTALKECPAIMSFVPDWMKNELKRVPPKRIRRPPIPKGEKKEIDMSELVAQATIAKLNL